MGRDVESVKCHHNLRDFLEGLLKLHDVIEVPFSFTVFERLKGAIVISNSVIASLDMHGSGACCYVQIDGQIISDHSLQCRKLAAIDALALAETESKVRRDN